jgi:hypothetical protein
LVAEGTPSELTGRFGARGSLEDVFMSITGRKIDELDQAESKD